VVSIVVYANLSSLTRVFRRRFGGRRYTQRRPPAHAPDPLVDCQTSRFLAMYYLYVEPNFIASLFSYGYQRAKGYTAQSGQQQG